MGDHSSPKGERALAPLSEGQQRFLLESEPDDVTGEEGVGIELRSGPDYAIAKSLERRGYGHVTGPGGALPGMYWNNAAGLDARAALQQGKRS
jgi:hypothetical protein